MFTPCCARTATQHNTRQDGTSSSWCNKHVTRLANILVVSIIHSCPKNLQRSRDVTEISSSRHPSRRECWRRHQPGRDNSRRTRYNPKVLRSLTPEQTPFEDGIFHLRLHFTPQYPSTPPNAHFITKLFHPNIAPRTGEVCVNTLKKDWNSKVTLSEILMVRIL